jgi:SAM-dependent methyltransferase
MNAVFPMALILQPKAQPQLAPPVALPRVLHVGSGKNFRPEWLNLDVEARWRPDFVFDLGRPLPADGRLVVATERFGTVTLGEGAFAAIVAHDVLEHLRELTTAMTTMLHWLEVGGVLHLSVPYELSLGAWSDPTHVRAFNERSFVYYAEWSWYLGWQTHRFHVRGLDFVPSGLGKALLAAGRPQDEILRTPRAIDQMRAELVKQPLSEQDKTALAHWHSRLG